MLAVHVRREVNEKSLSALFRSLFLSSIQNPADVTIVQEHYAKDYIVMISDYAMHFINLR